MNDIQQNTNLELFVVCRCDIFMIECIHALSTDDTSPDREIFQEFRHALRFLKIYCTETEAKQEVSRLTKLSAERQSTSSFTIGKSVYFYKPINILAEQLSAFNKLWPLDHPLTKRLIETANVYKPYHDIVARHVNNMLKAQTPKSIEKPKIVCCMSELLMHETCMNLFLVYVCATQNADSVIISSGELSCVLPLNYYKAATPDTMCYEAFCTFPVDDTHKLSKEDMFLITLIKDKEPISPAIEIKSIFPSKTLNDIKQYIFPWHPDPKYLHEVQAFLSHYRHGCSSRFHDIDSVNASNEFSDTNLTQENTEQ